MRRSNGMAIGAVKLLANIRALIKEADPDVAEDVKWRKPSNNMRGVPVWEHDGLICTGETYKAAVKLTFARGAALKVSSRLFNPALMAERAARSTFMRATRSTRRRSRHSSAPRQRRTGKPMRGRRHRGDRRRDPFRRCLTQHPASAGDDLARSNPVPENGSEKLQRSRSL